MFHRKAPEKSFINRREYRDKVLGCWTGKNIGGTLGAPMEGRREMFDVTFYTQNLRGNPVPNDDLDLQLAWLRALLNKKPARADARHAKSLMQFSCIRLSVSKKSACGVLFRVFALFPSRLYEPPGRETV